MLKVLVVLGFFTIYTFSKEIVFIQKVPFFYFFTILFKKYQIFEFLSITSPSPLPPHPFPYEKPQPSAVYNLKSVN